MPHNIARRSRAGDVAVACRKENPINKHNPGNFPKLPFYAVPCHRKV